MSNSSGRNCRIQAARRAHLQDTGDVFVDVEDAVRLGVVRQVDIGQID